MNQREKKTLFTVQFSSVQFTLVDVFHEDEDRDE